MNREQILENLDAATQVVVEHIREDYANQHPKDKKSKFYVRSHTPYYDIYVKEGNSCVYANLCDIDFVRAIISCLDTNERARLKQVVEAEEQYTKYVNDMLFYVNSFKNTNDEVHRRVLEDRFHIAKNNALSLKKGLGLGNTKKINKENDQGS